MEKIQYKITVVLFFLILAFPLLGGTLDKRLALNGVVESGAEETGVSIRGLINGETQSSLERYIRQNMPGRPLLVRIRNEILFSVFKVSPNNFYVLDSEKNILAWENISFYYQYDEPAGDGYISELMGKLKRLDDLFEQKGKQLYVFLTPCKLRYTDEAEIPYAYRFMIPEQTEGNYEKMVRGLKDSDIDYFDSIEYINNHVFDERVPLFYKTGFHWSAYAGNCVGAGFGEYLREKTGYRFPKVSIAAEPCGEPFFPDADCFYGMNILKPPYENYYKPVVTVEEEGLDKPGFLCRGGSFMGQSISMLIENDYFGKNVHMENINLFTDKFTNITSFYDYDSIDLPELLKGIDIVVLEVNEPAVSNMSFGFIDYLLEHPETISEE